MVEPSRVVELLVGHSSSRLSGTQENKHTHKWTLFVKPVNKDYDDFLDNKLIQKVKFQIHDSFPNPIRSVSKPPFKVTETGFASFSTYVTVYLNLPNQKPHTFPYELNLFTGDQDVQEEVQKLVIRGDTIPSAFAEQVKRYCKSKKRKASVISPTFQKSSHETKKVKRDKSEISEKIDRNEKEDSKEASSKNSRKHKEVKDLSLEVPMKMAKMETVERLRDTTESPTTNGAIETAEELTEKLNKCSDPYVVYKVSEFLLSMPNTTLFRSTLRLSFDLSNSSQPTLSEISRLLKITKKSKHSE